MPVLAYFTLPIGHQMDGTEKLVPAESERVYDVLSSSDPDGAYQLYQCVDMDGIPTNVTPVCRVHKPLLSTLPKVYLDTSAVSYLKQDDSLEKTGITRKFWEAAKANKFSLYLSDVTLEELLRCPEPKRSVLFDFLREVTYTKIVSTECEGLNPSQRQSAIQESCRSVAWQTFPTLLPLSTHGAMSSRHGTSSICQTEEP